MNDDPRNELSVEERLERLERTVGRLKLGVGFLLMVFVLSMIPTLGAVVGFLLYIALVAGAVVGLIIGIMYLLEHFYPGDRKRSRRR